MPASRGGCATNPLVVPRSNSAGWYDANPQKLESKRQEFLPEAGFDVGVDIDER